jgi:hypothetical protein
VFLSLTQRSGAFVTNLTRDSETEIVSEWEKVPVFIFQESKMWFYTSKAEVIRLDVFDGMIQEEVIEKPDWKQIIFSELPSEAQMRIFFESL